MDKYSIGVPVRNEANSIVKMLNSLNQDITKAKLNIETLICINDCTDNSLDVAQNAQNRFPNLHISVLTSEPGLINAQKKIIQESTSNNDFVIFYNADLLIQQRSTKALIEGFNNQNVHAVFGEQMPFKMNSFWYEVFNIEALNPQISQPDRKYILGRCFGIRKESYFIPDGFIADDMFLSRHLYTKYGESALLRIPEAIVNYMGPQTFKDYFNKIKRYTALGKQMYKMYPEFEASKNFFHRETSLYEVNKLSSKQKLQLFLHDKIKLMFKKIEPYAKGEIWEPLTSTKNI